MNKMLSLILASGFSWVGWWLGSQFSLMIGFTLSMVGVGLGLYAANRLAAHYLG